MRLLAVIVGVLAVACPALCFNHRKSALQPRQLSEGSQQRYDEMVALQMKDEEHEADVNLDGIVFTLTTPYTVPEGVKFSGNDVSLGILSNIVLMMDVANPFIIVIPPVIPMFLTDVPNWVDIATQVFVGTESANVISVDWAAIVPDDTMNIFQMIKYLKTVAKQVNILISNVTDITDGDIASVRIVGHQVGAHIAGMAALGLETRVDHIVGLDPSGPYFDSSDRDKSEYLDATDADFVEIYHTNAGNVEQGATGFQAAVGHVDYYPNGGFKQPGCRKSVFHTLTKAFKDIVNGKGVDKGDYCSSERAVSLYLEGVTSTIKARGYKCSSYELFMNGNCLINEESEIGAAKPPQHGVFYFQTTKRSPYLVDHVYVSAELEEPTNGQIYLLVTGGGFPVFTQIIDEGVDGINVTDMITVPVGTNVTTLSTTLMYRKGRFSNKNQIKLLSFALSSISNIYSFVQTVVRCAIALTSALPVTIFLFLIGTGSCRTIYDIIGGWLLG